MGTTTADAIKQHSYKCSFEISLKLFQFPMKDKILGIDIPRVIFSKLTEPRESYVTGNHQSGMKVEKFAFVFKTISPFVVDYPEDG